MQKTFDREYGPNEQLQSEVAPGNVQIQQLKDRLRVRDEDRILLHSGQATLTRSGHALLDKRVPTLQKAADFRIEAKGFTDDVPVGKHLRGRYKSNWELSAARAASVVGYLQKKGIDSSRLTAAGLIHYQPSSSNATDLGLA